MKLIAARRAARLVGPLSREGLPARDRGELEVERAVAELGLAHLCAGGRAGERLWGARPGQERGVQRSGGAERAGQGRGARRGAPRCGGPR